MSKIVFITGANQGLGFQIAKKLALEHAGYHVFVGSRKLSAGEDAVAELRALPLQGTVEAIQVDVTVPESLAAAAAAVDAKFGKLDELVVNAGISRVPGVTPPVAGGAPFDVPSLRAIFEVNVFGAAATVDAFVPLLKKSGDAQIVFMSSGVGSITDTLDPNFAYYKRLPHIQAYRTSKAALNMLMANYSLDLEDFGIRANACCPGYCSTNMNGYSEYGADPKEGAINAVSLITERRETGTYTNSSGRILF